MNDIYIGAYWSPRQESVSSCASRAKKMFSSLASHSAVFSRWYELGESRKDALKRSVDTNNTDKIAEFLQKGRGRRDDDKSIIEDLGFRIGLWNGENDQFSASISIRCGLYVANPNLSNSIVVNLPSTLDILANWETMLSVFSSIVEAWQPDYGGVIDRRSRDTRNYIPHIPFVDWMVYIAGKEVALSNISKPSVVHKVEQLGWIIVVQAEPVQFDNPDHLRNVRAVESALPVHEFEIK